MNKEAITGQKVLVIGSGLSGIGSAQLLRRVGAHPVVLEENTARSAVAIREKLSGTGAPDTETEIIMGRIPSSRLDEFVLAIPSPAVPLDGETMTRIKGRGIPVWSEVELAVNYAQGQLIAITGTNGKTTTTTLVGDIMKAHQGEPHVRVLGNIGLSFAAHADEIKPEDVTVAEISSFQLEAVEHFHAHVSAILNITPDHLNRHHTMENYAACKERITNLQTQEDTCVLNYDDAWTRAIGERCPAHVVWFSTAERITGEMDGLWLDGNEIVYHRASGEDERLMRRDQMNLVGLCNVQNVMAAIAMADAAGVPMNTILHTVRHFHAVEHRIEYVATKGGVRYYNDSKATNPDAAIQGIRAMSWPTVLIGGGYDKQNTYDDWINAFGDTVKDLVLIGATAQAIEDCAKSHGFNEAHIHRAEDYSRALALCTELAKPGDAVLLSPACASWDMFPNYETRGKQFKEYVNGLS
ncbi:MAG: UDP-N-acetylmuramoyl-L-alanine--D-glutamate ligase [Butyrivibrio sp.]|nr:UDP-N-acetylmuramoyl-L-alanine--D-glutamate ligase [Butyrivibrio sp.]